jgi:FAD/FMN-containing dehydrogenase/Fe-S oxidoreductase
MAIRKARPAFWTRLANEIEGDVASDLFALGRYATDASIYQCFPAGVACPRNAGDISIIMEMAREEGLPIIARGGGTSTAGQALGDGIIVDFSKYLNSVVRIEPENRRCLVEPGCPPATLNAALESWDLVFPVDIASAHQATIGGMLGNNSSGIRALRHGSMRDNVASVDAFLADGQRVLFGEVSEADGSNRPSLPGSPPSPRGEREKRPAPSPQGDWVKKGKPSFQAGGEQQRSFSPSGEGQDEGVYDRSYRASQAPGRDRLLDLLQFGELHEKAIATLWPLRAPGTPEPEGYDLRTLLASAEDQNLARILAGSEGTLALAAKIELKLAKRPANRALGICRFAELSSALRLVPKIMVLNPSAIELLDRTLLEFLALRARGNAQAARLLQGDPDALLIVEFDEDNPVENTRLLKALDDYAAEAGKGKLGVVEIIGENARAALWRLRREALTQAWSLKSAAQPLPFLEDGAVPVHRLAAYGTELEGLFDKHGVRFAIYGQVGCGCLNVRPILNLRHADDRRRMRDLADEMASLLRAHGGGLTAGHGIGLSRSEALERALGPEAIGLFAQLKSQLDPTFLLNPGKIVRAPRFDEPALLRALPESKSSEGPVSLAWGPAASPERALDHARRCNGLSLCRVAQPHFACPSYAVTRDERDSPRGRANTMRLALSGQLGEGALASPPMLDAMRLCVSCKSCKVTCPFGIDIPKMKAEALAAARAGGRLSRAEDLFAGLPEYTERARRWRAFINMRDLLPGLPRFTERHLGLAADRPWPKWTGRRFRAPRTVKPGPSGTVALFADTFNRSFEPANLRAAASVLTAAGHGVLAFVDEKQDRALCCGRTYYDAGYVSEARREATRMNAALASFEEKRIPVVGLEPACVLMMRDEYAALGLPPRDRPPMLLFEEFVGARIAEGNFALPLKPIEADLMLHAHCHERALGLEGAAQAALKLVPELAISAAPPGCCGLNGFVGMTPDTFEASLAMAELALFPAIRKAGRDAFVAATGFSCRKQIHDGLGRPARHPAMILELALKGDAEIVS